MARTKTETIARASDEVRKSFNLTKFKEKKGFGAENAKYKEQTWIPLSKAWQEATGLIGIPQGHVTMLRGHSDSGKSCTLFSCAAQCQKMGILPVLIITELKMDWHFLKAMGVQYEEIVNQETGEVEGYDGFFIYADRGQLKTIEDVAAFMADLLDEQEKGNLPYDLCFLWDSVGSVPCRQAVESKTNNNQWTANSLSVNFAGFINQRIVLSRKASYPWTNTFCFTNKVWVSPPETIMSAPRMNSRGGNAMFYDSSLVVEFGNIANAGTVKLKAIAGGHEIEFAKRTNVSIAKNHITGLSSRGKIVMTPTGFISLEEVEKYKLEHKKEWAKQLDVAESDINFQEEAESVDTGIAYAEEPA